MNNEVKILSILEQLQEGLSGVQEDLQGVKEDLQGVREDLQDVKEDLQGVKEDLQGVREDLGSFKVEVREEFKDIRGELKEVRGELKEVRAYQFSMGKRLEKVEVSQKDMQESMDNIRKSQLRVEIDQFPRITLALDSAHGANEKNIEQDGRIFNLEEQVEQHDFEITALKSS